MAVVDLALSQRPDVVLPMDGTEWVDITQSGESRKCRAADLLNIAMPVRQITTGGLAGTSRADVGRIIESISASAVGIVIDTDAVSGWLAQDTLYGEQVGAGIITIAHAQGNTHLLNADGAYRTRGAGAPWRARRSSANLWVLTGDLMV